MENESIRLEIYNSFAKTGCSPSVKELAATLSLTESKVKEGLEALARDRHIVLNENLDVVMAHPFSSVPLGFSVMGKSTLWWGGCAWDSFALPHLLTDEHDLLVATTCPNCKVALSWNLNRHSEPIGNEVAHFLVPTTHMWDDVVHTCGNQRLFCSRDCVDAWLTKNKLPMGYVMDLGTLWKLASKWYESRLTRGYVRREPAAAKEYFGSVGLSGKFWGLD